ncbi:unnamed protein product [Plutella xylostella]|uniref:(diamondback moth) hypothetical protein n=1 Tax=Plutella xylostella TaxID=51655 RepID=A0A8S4G613_PLUXY|nr:unnamed protein product [Plutella xylostella]
MASAHLPLLGETKTNKMLISWMNWSQAEREVQAPSSGTESCQKPAPHFLSHSRSLCSERPESESPSSLMLKEEAATFGRWLRGLDELDGLQIPRCYDPTQGRRQLHVFCDASEVAYAAAAYWRVEHPDGSIAVAKSKVAPIKALSIPRLELQAAVIGTRLADMVQREHRWKSESVHYWTDSRTVLQ